MQGEGTAWEAGRLDGAVGPKDVLFGITYEDPRIELAAFPEGGRVMCIASAGCTARALSHHCDVVAVDINPVQLEYARGRLAGEAAVRGKAERVMATVRPLMALVGIHRPALEAFLALSDLQEQATRWQELRTARFRMGMDVLFSFTGGLRLVYASPMLELLPPRFGRVLLERFDRSFAIHPNADNPYARALFLGDSPLFDPAPLGRRPVDLVCADAASFLEAQPAGSFDGVSLSNILDGATPGYAERLFAAVRHAARPEAKVVLRSFGEPAEPGHAEDAARDRSMLWGSVRVTRAAALGA